MPGSRTIHCLLFVLALAAAPAAQHHELHATAGEQGEAHRCGCHTDEPPVAYGTSLLQPPWNVALRSQYADPGIVYTDVWAEGDYAYVGHYDDNRVDIIDISDPDAPFLAAFWDVPAPDTDASTYDVKVFDGLMYVCLERSTANAVAIVDVRDPLNPVLLTRIDIDPSLNGSHNTDLLDGWLYVANTDTPDVIIFDLRSYDPDNPPALITTPAYQFQIPGSLWVHDMTAQDGRLYVAAWETLEVFDVSNLGNGPPIWLGRAEGVGVHSVWPTDDGRFLVTAEERTRGPLRLYEVIEGVGSVTLLQRDAFSLPYDEAATAHNPVMRGDFLYASYMQAGLQVLTIDPGRARFHRVASYDTSTMVPPPSPPVWAGNWGVYPFLGSDRVLLSDMQEGFFIVDVDALDIRLVNDAPTQALEGFVARVRVDIRSEGSPLDGTSVELVSRVDGGPEIVTTMAASGPDYMADLPSADCGAEITWYVRADNLDGTTFTLPADAPTDTFATVIVSGMVTVLADDFETDQGWTVQNTNVSHGAWERGDPVGTSAQPEDDAGDGSFCYFTGQGVPGGHVSLEDLDGGPTHLISPAFDLAGQDGVISYSYWHYNVKGDDPLVVELSEDDGASWTEVIRHEFGAGQWYDHAFRVSDHVTPSAQLRLRFSISDNPTNTITEAAVDEISIRRFHCTWQDLGGALAGTHGEPTLAGDGTLQADDPLTITLADALENTTAYLVVGLAAAPIPFEGGMLIPDVTPPGFFVVLFTDGTGGFVIQETWPTGIPSGFELYLQYWMLDPAGIFGWSGSNALKATAP